METENPQKRREPQYGLYHIRYTERALMRRRIWTWLAIASLGVATLIYGLAY